jgi:hypothetical protein
MSISEALHNFFKADFLDYGVVMERFFVTAIVKPEEDPNYRRFKELHFRKPHQPPAMQVSLAPSATTRFQLLQCSFKSYPWVAAFPQIIKWGILSLQKPQSLR